MPGSHQYGSGWLPKPPVVTHSSSRSHYWVLLLANEFVSNHVICKCRTQLCVEPVLPTGAEIKRLSVGILLNWKQLCNPYFFRGWFGSLFQKHLIGILIGTVLKQLSDENHFDFYFHHLFILFFFKATVVNSRFSQLPASVTFRLPPRGWLLDLLTFDHKRYTCVIKLFWKCAAAALF